MGVLGRGLLGLLGNKIGDFAGKKLGRFTGIHGDRGSAVGKSIGESLGDLLPFKKGGRVPKTGAIMAHKGEFVLPKGVKPTVKQVKAVRKRGGRMKKAAKKKGAKRTRRKI